MKFHEPLSSAKAVIGLLIVSIVFILVHKFFVNQDYFTSDPEMARNYLALTILGSAFLIVLFYLVSKTTNKKVSKPAKSSKKKKK